MSRSNLCRRARGTLRRLGIAVQHRTMAPDCPRNERQIRDLCANLDHLIRQADGEGHPDLAVLWTLANPA